MRTRDASDRILLASIEEAREMDRLTIETFGLPGELLMEMAGAGTTQIIEALYGSGAGRAAILCGSGNNAGDGYVVARHLLGQGWDVMVLSLRALEQLDGETRLNHQRFIECGGDVRVQSKKVTGRARNRIKHADIIVDALFGIGLSRPIEGLLKNS